MFSSLSYKKKNFILLAGSLLFMVIIYQVSIKETMEKKQSLNTLIIQSEQLKGAPAQIAQLNNELQQLDDWIGYIRSDSLDTQQMILEKVTNYCDKHHIELKKFIRPQLENEPNYQVETVQFVVEGSFIPLLKLVYAFEQQYKLGKVVSVDFNMEKELRSQKELLYATIFIQNIRKS